MEQKSSISRKSEFFEVWMRAYSGFKRIISIFYTCMILSLRHLMMILEGAFPALDELKQSGKIRYFGVSGLPMSVFEKALAHKELDSVLSYCHYALNDTSLLDVVPLLEQHGVGLVNASPLSMGLLSTRPAADWHPASGEIQRLCKQAAEHCASKGN